jgi:hypothetical protein
MTNQPPSSTPKMPMPLHIKIRVGIEYAWLWLSNPKFRARTDKARAFYEHMMVKGHRIWFC